MLAIALTWLALPAAAAPPDDFPEEEEELDLDLPSRPVPADDEDWGFDTKTKARIASDEDDPGMVDFVAAEKKKAPPPTWFHLDPTGREPLADDWDIQVLSLSPDFVVVELPVLVARTRAEFAAAHPGGLLLVGEIGSGPHRVRQEHVVKAESVYESAPTWVFLKTALPIREASGPVSYRVATAELPPPPDPAAPPPPKGSKPPEPPPPPVVKDRYARTTVFLRK